MGEVIGDVIVPKEIIVPKKETAYTGKEGSLFLSGSKLWFHNGSAVVIVTSG